MKFTIIRPDGLVAVDGLFLPVNLSLTSNKLRVVQWDGEKGHEEWTDQENTELLSLDPYQHIVDAWNVKKAEIDAKATDPYYGMTKEEIQVIMESKIVAEEDRVSWLPIEFPTSSGIFHKVTTAIPNTVKRYEDLELTDTMPINNGCWDDVNGTSIPFTYGDLVNLQKAIYDRAAYNYGVKKYHTVEMKKVTKPQNYNYLVGWK